MVEHRFAFNGPGSNGLVSGEHDESGGSDEWQPRFERAAVELFQGAKAEADIRTGLLG